MKSLNVDLGERSYEIRIGAGILDDLGEALVPLGLGRRCVVVTNPLVGSHYLERVTGSLEGAGYAVRPLTVQDGEEYKSLPSAVDLYAGMLSWGLDRSGFVVALGGGVIGDLAGFAAATYMRGVDLVQIPTTLLAQVDSSVGGKVGVNLREGKNLVGSFYQPRLVWIDPDVLSTLAEREVRAGFAEVIKYGVIGDRDLFVFLEENFAKILSLEKAPLETAIHRSCEIKADIVSKDERESGLRAVLNYGHTIGHAIETATAYRVYRHGEALAIGMACAAKIALGMGFLPKEDCARLLDLLRRSDLPVRALGLWPEDVLEALRRDKKIRDGTIRFVLSRGLGEVFVSEEVAEEMIGGVLREK